ncbi:hypothetical protein R1sor_025334 [Riccia sorocarpa]|uniref:Endonuclease/exonuclease/phosphatase domain-containing protein n=1 Tax=Riccia sorocarpa TaxID=122646 RepID=A0ABD3GC03_9MARC
MVGERFKVGTWNTNGLGGENRLGVVQSWLKGESRFRKVLAIQELKTKEETAEFNLRRLIPNAPVVVDYAENEQGGAALLLHHSLKILTKGVRGSGNCAWARTEIDGEIVGFASEYGPHHWDERMNLFRWIKDLGSGENWVFLGTAIWSLTPETQRVHLPYSKVHHFRTKEVFKAFREKDRNKITGLRSKKEKLGEFRSTLNSLQSDTVLEEYRILEKEVREAEFLEASVLKRKSRVKWITEGKANCRYFFHCMKAKQDQKKLTVLKTDEGELGDDEVKIMQKIKKFYQQLYTQPEIVEEDREHRKQVLTLIRQFVREGEGTRNSSRKNGQR